MNIKIDINVCRVCLKSEGGNSVFNENTAENFYFSTLVKIKEGDGMPTIICNRCEARLKISYEFKKQAIVSDAQIRAFIDRINNQFREVTNISSAVSIENGKNYDEDEEIKLLMEAGYNPSNVTTTNDAIDESIQHQYQNHDDHNHVVSKSSISTIQDNEKNDLIEQDQIDGIIDNSQIVQNDEEEEVEEEEDDDFNGLIQIQEQDDSSIQEYDESAGQSAEIENGANIIEELNEEDNKNMQDITTTQHHNITQHENAENQKLIPVEFIITEFPAVTTITTSGDPLKPDTKSEKKPRHESRSNICTKCDRDFSTKTNLIRHMMTHDGVKPFQCNICGNGFTQSGSLKQHLLIHSGERPHKCQICGRGFTQSKSLIFHTRRHTGEKPFACDKCGLTFRQKDGMKRHIAMKHEGTASEVHVCSICSRVLQSKYSLQVHMKKHLSQPDSLHRCEICEKSFSTKHSLEIHQRQHTGEKPYKCMCGKEFPRKSSLLTHSKLHLLEKPYKCDQCAKGFVQKHLLIAHVENIHNSKPVKSFQCGKCFKSFAIKRNLFQHLRNHNKENMIMYKCEECSIAFNTKRGLKLHRFNQHKETVSDLNECDICNIPFVSVNDLNQHMTVVHDSIDEKCGICMEHFTSKKLLDDHLLEHELVTVSQTT